MMVVIDADYKSYGFNRQYFQWIFSFEVAHKAWY